MANIVKPQTPNETEQKVIDYLTSQMIYKWEIVYCGEDLVSEWNHDKWSIMIHRFGDKRVIEQFEYKTGLGHRYLQPSALTEHVEGVDASNAKTENNERQKATRDKSDIGGAVWKEFCDMGMMKKLAKKAKKKKQWAHTQEHTHTGQK